MLEVTQAAGDVIKQLLAQEEAPDTHSVRLAAKGEGLAIVLDEASPEDVTILSGEGERPLVIAEPPIADRLDGHTLDFHAESSRLVIN